MPADVDAARDGRTGSVERRVGTGAGPLIRRRYSPGMMHDDRRSTKAGIMNGDATDVVDAWPALRVSDWQPTRDTLHLWTQIVGKVRLANTPLVNHWWNITLYVTTHGLTTSLIPYGDARAFRIDFDFQEHRLDITTTDGATRGIALLAKPVAEFYSEVMGALDALGLSTRIWTMPVEIEGAIPFERDFEHAHYDSAAVSRFWQTLVHTDRVFNEFRSGFVGKASPVHFFWGAFDLAVTRFSGNTAPPHPGGAPNCGPHVMLEAYSHEVSSCGYWPGGADEGIYYSYAYPEAPGFRDRPVMPASAYYDETLGEFVLPYADVRRADAPDRVLTEFLESTYAAAADAGGWNRVALERSSPAG
jgi:hypothetical protein